MPKQLLIVSALLLALTACSGGSDGAGQPSTSTIPTATEGSFTIKGTFEGWFGPGTTVELTNGQIWQQTDELYDTYNAGDTQTYISAGADGSGWHMEVGDTLSTAAAVELTNPPSTTITPTSDNDFPNGVWSYSEIVGDDGFVIAGDSIHLWTPTSVIDYTDRLLEDLGCYNKVDFTYERDVVADYEVTGSFTTGLVLKISHKINGTVYVQTTRMTYVGPVTPQTEAQWDARFQPLC